MANLANKLKIRSFCYFCVIFVLEALEKYFDVDFSVPILITTLFLLHQIFMTNELHRIIKLLNATALPHQILFGITEAICPVMSTQFPK